jgi:hypothetical protein
MKVAAVAMLDKLARLVMFNTQVSRIPFIYLKVAKMSKVAKTSSVELKVSTFPASSERWQRERRLVDLSRSEQVETDLDRLIEKLHDQRALSEGERAAEELWAESVRRYNARQEEEHRLAWCEHYRRMRAVHYGLGDEYDAKLRELEKGHHRGEG